MSIEDADRFALSLGEHVTREQYDSITPAVHMNKPGWYELYLEYLEDDLARQLITTSYNLVANAW